MQWAATRKRRQGQQPGHRPQPQRREPRAGRGEDDRPANAPAGIPPGKPNDSPYHYLGYQHPVNAGSVINYANPGSAGIVPHSSPTTTGQATHLVGTHERGGYAGPSRASVDTREAPGPEGGPAASMPPSGPRPIYAVESQPRDSILGDPAPHGMGIGPDAQPRWVQHDTTRRSNENLLELIRESLYGTEAWPPPPKADHHLTHKAYNKLWHIAHGNGSRIVTKIYTEGPSPYYPRISQTPRPTSCGTSTSLLGSHSCASTSS